MLSFPFQKIFFFSDWLGVLEKADLGDDGKPTYF